MYKRSRAREIALQVLYLHDLNAQADVMDTVRFISRRLRSAELAEYARALVGGVTEHQAELDALIGEAAENWKLGRMAVIDRNILRLGLYEMRYGAIPPRVAINESLELAKRYSTAQSSRFVNGILDRLQPESAPGAGNGQDAAPAPGESAEPAGDRPPPAQETSLSNDVSAG